MKLQILAISFLAVAPAWAAGGIDATLDGNRAACQGSTTLTGTLRTEYSLVGQGLKGTAFSIIDLKSGIYAEGYEQGPTGGGDGFDGKQPWMKDQSGAVTPEEGGDKLQLAINNAYRNANLWWRADRGGAAIAGDGTKTDGGNTYDVLTIVPKDGVSFD